jgi:UDP-N-acetylglucosamine transferase subunit ALG13
MVDSPHLQRLEDAKNTLVFTHRGRGEVVDDLRLDAHGVVVLR